MLSDRSLQWLRSALGAVPAPGPDGDELGVVMGLAAASLARRTPAWIEHDVAVLDALVARTPEPTSLRLLLISLRLGVADDARLAAEQRLLVAPVAASLDAPSVPNTSSEAKALTRLALFAAGEVTTARGGSDGALAAAVERTTPDPEAALRLALTSIGHDTMSSDALFDATRSLPLPSSRAAAYALLLARDRGLADVASELRAQAVVDGDDPVVAALLAAADATGPQPGVLTALLREPLPRLPQVVGVEVPAMALARAEWLHECLCLELAPAEVQPTKFTHFRIVGTELRIWCQTGVDGVRTDTTGQGVVVRAPLVAGPLEFTPGSY